MRKFIKALPISVGLPLVIGAASVGPDDAASNISKWAGRLGIHDMPPWLTEKVADHRMIIAAVLLSIAYAFTVWIVPRRRKTHGDFIRPLPGAVCLPSGAHSSPVRIEALAKVALISRVETFTRQLRSFEAQENGATDVEEARIAATLARVCGVRKSIRGDKAEEGKLENEALALEAKANCLDAARERRRLLEFQARFSQEAIRLRAELSRRTGRPTGGVDDPMRDLLNNDKFSLDSLKVLSSYLHEMVDRLPD